MGKRELPLEKSIDEDVELVALESHTPSDADMINELLATPEIRFHLARPKGYRLSVHRHCLQVEHFKMGFVKSRSRMS